jgi:hypothetical protein
MLKVSEHSEDCYKSEIDLFSVPPTQIAIESGSWDTIQPSDSFNKGNVVEFKIPKDSHHYIDLSQTQLYLKVRLSQGANQQNNVIPVNNFLHSLFEDITVRFNGTIVEQTGRTYPYRAYIEDLLNYDSESKSTFLQQQLFYKDEYTDTHTIEKFHETNNNGIARHNFVVNGMNPMIGFLHLDTFKMNRYLLNDVEVNLQMTRSPNNFNLIANQDGIYKVDFLSAYLKVRRIVLSPSIMLNHAMQLEKTTAKYPIKKVLVKQYNMSFNTNTNYVELCNGIIPSRVIIGFLKNKTMAGDITTNPYYFEHFNLSQISLRLASKLVPYTTPLLFEFAGPTTITDPNKNNILEGYNTLFTNIRHAGSDISYKDFINGYFLLCFDLSPDLCSDSHYNMLSDGKLELITQFQTADNANAISVVAYLEYDSIIEITKERNAIANYL